MTSQPDASTVATSPPPQARLTRRRLTFAMRSGALLIIGAGLGAGAATLAHRSQASFLVPVTPAPIAKMSAWTWQPVAVKGSVAEIFGNKFIIQDDSGRALIETGPRGEGGRLVAKGETVTVQGRFESGFLHASAIVHGDGRVDDVGPPRPPRGPGLLSWLHADAGAGPGQSAVRNAA